MFLEYENLTDEEWDIVMMFDLMWFVCPTPFKKGDIVSFHPEALVEDTEEFVLESICYENMDERHFKMRREIGGSMDMTADGYFADTDGQLSMLEMSKSLLQSRLEQAREDYSKKGRMYRSTGVLLGIGAAVTLI